MRHRNPTHAGQASHDVTAERRIEIKIGIHIGDVVHRGGDVYGDGVNIASRIEALAGAGGICVSMDVERQIRNALEARFEKLARTELKNISVPMDLFRIVLPWQQAGTSRIDQEGSKRGRKRTQPALWAAILRVGRGVTFSADVGVKRVPGGTAQLRHCLKSLRRIILARLHNDAPVRGSKHLAASL